MVPAGAELGERPFWDAATGTLCWVDIHAGRLHRYRPGAGVDEVHLEAGVPVGAAAPRRGGGYVLAAADGFRLAGPDGPAAAGRRSGRPGWRRTSGSTTAPAIRPGGSGPAPWPRTGGPAAARCTGSTPGAGSP